LKATPTRVLVIDDDPLIRTLLVSTLKKDCLVVAAAEGSEGFQKALELTPDVAVIDVNMPGWDGLKTLEAFRAHPGLKSVKVIMLTADASEQTVTAAIHGGAHDYLIKTNFSKADFYGKLNRLVPGSIAEVPPLSVPAGAELECASTAVSPTNPHADLSIGVRDPALVSSRQDPGQSALATPALAAASASVESRLQELIDAWE